MRKGPGLAATAAVLTGVVFVIFFAVVLAVLSHSKNGEQAEKQSGNSSPTEDMTQASDGSNNGEETSEEAASVSHGGEDTQGENSSPGGNSFPDGSGEPGAEAAPTLSSEEDPNPAETPESTDTPEVVGSQAELLLEEMSLREKVYQLFIVFPSQVTGVSPVTQAGDLTRQGLAEYPVGGFLYNKTNMVSREQVTEMLTTVQTYSRIPLLLTCDEEGGRVNRLMGTVGTTYIDSMISYKDQGTEKAAENAEIIAGDMVSCGFNADFAPVADVWSNPQNTVIGDRAYSDDFSQAAELVAAAVEGFHKGGVACTLKHFPGHGDTEEDSHNGAVYVAKTLEELRAGELLPFQAGIDAGADMVMIGHLTVADVEEVPALFSYEIVTRLLREEMGFEGVVITDSLQMKAVTKYYDSGQAAVLAVQAGVDILLCPENLEEAADALMDAVETGVISKERLNQSVLRILKLKEERGILRR